MTVQVAPSEFVCSARLCAGLGSLLSLLMQMHCRGGRGCEASKVPPALQYWAAAGGKIKYYRRVFDRLVHLRPPLPTPPPPSPSALQRRSTPLAPFTFLCLRPFPTQILPLPRTLLVLVSVCTLCRCVPRGGTPSPSFGYRFFCDFVVISFFSAVERLAAPGR